MCLFSTNLLRLSYKNKLTWYWSLTDHLDVQWDVHKPVWNPSVHGWTDLPPISPKVPSSLAIALLTRSQ